jgi:hypothetical protein
MGMRSCLSSDETRRTANDAISTKIASPPCDAVTIRVEKLTPSRSLTTV